MAIDRVDQGISSDRMSAASLAPVENDAVVKVLLREDSQCCRRKVRVLDYGCKRRVGPATACNIPIAASVAGQRLHDMTVERGIASFR